jgi:hypothetical protein
MNDRMLRSHIGVMLLLCMIGICCLLFNGDVISIIGGILSAIYSIGTNTFNSDNIAMFMLVFMGICCMFIMFVVFILIIFTPSPSDRIETEENIDWKRNG